MLPVENRLKQEKDFAILAKSRKSAYARSFMVKVRENALPHSRFGIVVGLKVHKRAVKRNLIKRRVREILRKELPSLKSGYDVMVLALPSAVGVEFADIRTQLLSALKKVGMLKHAP